MIENKNNTNKLTARFDSINLIKNLKSIIIYTLLFTILYLFFFKINLKTEPLMVFEQTIFIIMSVIIIVFNESLISDSSIFKIRNLLNNLKETKTKEIIFSKVGRKEDEISPNYEEYFNILNEKVEKFEKDKKIFSKNSYRLYTIFTISGFIAIICSVSSVNLIDMKIINFHINQIYLHLFKTYLIGIFIALQICLIPIWIISAHQSEKQKNKIMNFFENPIEIVKDFEKYLEEIEDKQINMYLNNINQRGS